MNRTNHSYQLIIKALCFCVATGFCTASRTVPDERTLVYKVFQNGKEIGALHLNCSEQNNRTYFSLNSKVEKKVIGTLSFIEHQEAEFIGEKMIRSYIHREVNGKTKLDQRTSYKGSYYEVSSGKSLKKATISTVSINQLSIYFKEPSDKSKMYSDVHQCFIDVQKLGNEQYKIELPDGNTTRFYYRDGVCCKVIAEQSFFTLLFVLQ